MNAGGVDAVDLLDRPADLTFKGTNAGDFLHERGQPERTDIVEEFITGVGAVWQAPLSQQKPRLARRAGRNLKARTVRADLEGHVGLGQRDAYLVEVGRIKTDIKRLVSRLVNEEGRSNDDRN
jgi:hypothetical protein